MLDELPPEEWKPLLLKSRWTYEISSHGRVRARSEGGNKTVIKSWRPDSCGYPLIRVGGKGGGKYKGYRIHVLVAKTFIENPLGKPEVNHKDGVKTNNVVSNLEWVTGPENREHAYKLGLARGPTLSTADIERVFQRRIDGLTNKQIATEFGVSYNIIKNLFSGEYLHARGLTAPKSLHGNAKSKDA